MDHGIFVRYRSGMQRRHFLAAIAGTGAWRLAAQNRVPRMAESDPANAKLCHRIDAKSVTDDDLRFLQQIGLTWVRLEFGEGEVTLDSLRAQQERFARF